MNIFFLCFVLCFFVWLVGWGSFWLFGFFFFLWGVCDCCFEVRGFFCYFSYQITTLNGVFLLLFFELGTRSFWHPLLVNLKAAQTHRYA